MSVPPTQIISCLSISNIASQVVRRKVKNELVRIKSYSSVCYQVQKRYGQNYGMQRNQCDFYNKLGGEKRCKVGNKKFSTSLFTKRTSINNNSNKHHLSWRNPIFMIDESPQEKEKWLKSILEKANFRLNNADGTYIIDEKGVQIDSYAYLLVLKSWSHSGMNQAAQKCEEILSRLERHYDAANKMNNDLQSSVGKERGKYDNTYVLIEKILMDLQPTVGCYNEVIRAWSSTNKPIVARAERWLDTLRRKRDYSYQMKKGIAVDSPDDSSLHNVTVPNTESYNLLLSILSKGSEKKNRILVDNATKAQNLLQEMISVQEQFGDDTAQPNTETFNYVIRKSGSQHIQNMCHVPHIYSLFPTY